MTKVSDLNNHYSQQLDPLNLFQPNRGVKSDENLSLARDILEQCLDPGVDFDEPEEKKTKRRRSQIWNAWLDFANTCGFDGRENWIDLHSGCNVAFGRCTAFLKFYVVSSTARRPFLRGDEWQTVRTVNSAITLEDIWTSLVKRADAEVMEAKRKQVPRHEGANWRLKVSAGKRDLLIPVDRIASHIPMLSKELGLSLSQRYEKKDFSAEDTLIFLSTLWEQAEKIRCAQRQRNAMRSATTVLALGGFRPESVMGLKYKDVEIGWFYFADHPLKYILAATITIYHVKQKKNKIQREQRDRLKFSITFVPNAAVCLLSSLLSQAISDDAFKASYSSYPEIEQKKSSHKNAQYIPLPWKDTMLDKAIIPLAYHTFLNIWSRTLLVMGVPSDRVPRPYAMRVGAGNRMHGILTTHLSNFIMNHSTAVYERSYQAIHTKVNLMEVAFPGLLHNDSHYISLMAGATARRDPNAPVDVPEADFIEFEKRNDLRILRESRAAMVPNSPEYQKVKGSISYIISCLEKQRLKELRDEYFTTVYKKSQHESPKQSLPCRKLKYMPSCSTAERIGEKFKQPNERSFIDMVVSYLRNEPAPTTDNIKARSIQCLLCQDGHIFTQISSLTRHTLHSHMDLLDKVSFECPQCRLEGTPKRVENGAPGWSRHIHEYHAASGVPKLAQAFSKMAYCPLCAKTLTSRGFTNHYNGKHLKQQVFPFQCPLYVGSLISCTASLETHEQWRQHLNVCHEGSTEVPFSVALSQQPPRGMKRVSSKDPSSNQNIKRQRESPLSTYKQLKECNNNLFIDPNLSRDF